MKTIDTTKMNAIDIICIIIVLILISPAILTYEVSSWLIKIGMYLITWLTLPIDGDVNNTI